MTKPRRIDMWAKDDMYYYARFTFDYDLIDFFRHLPINERAFDNDEKVWIFAVKHLSEVVSTARHFAFDDVIVWPIGQAPPPKRPKSKRPRAKLMLDFINLLPHDALVAAYRRAASTLHPDHGGSNEQMQKLNAVWHEIEKLSKE